MRIVVLADIHGNLPAFEAAVDALPKLAADRVVVLGDVVNGAPDSGACWQLAQSLNCPMIKGIWNRPGLWRGFICVKSQRVVIRLCLLCISIRSGLIKQKYP